MPPKQSKIGVLGLFEGDNPLRTSPLGGQKHQSFEEFTIDRRKESLNCYINGSLTTSNIELSSKYFG